MATDNESQTQIQDTPNTYRSLKWHRVFKEESGCTVDNDEERLVTVIRGVVNDVDFHSQTFPQYEDPSRQHGYVLILWAFLLATTARPNVVRCITSKCWQKYETVYHQ